MQKIKRMGLAKIKSGSLQQNQHYLFGLHKFNMRKKGGNYSEAIRHFLKSVCCSNYQIHAITRKTLLKLNTILMRLYEREITELSHLNVSIARMIQEDEQVLPRRISRRIDRRISNKERTSAVSRSIKIMRSKSSTEKRSTEVVLLRAANVDDSMSALSGKTQMRFLESKEEGKRVDSLQRSVKRLEDNLNWVKIRLSQHVVDRRSICFVLDTDFQHVKQE